LFTLADKLNLGLVLKFKQEEGQFVVARYVLNHPAAFYKIVLNANKSIKLEKTLKMLAFVEYGEGDPEMITLIGDYLEDFFKLVKDKLLFSLYIGICKVTGLLPPWCLTKLPHHLQEQIFDLLNLLEIF